MIRQFLFCFTLAAGCGKGPQTFEDARLEKTQGPLPGLTKSPDPQTKELPQTGKDGCVDEMKSACAALQKEMQELRERRTVAVGDRDTQLANLLTLEIGLKSELLVLYLSGRNEVSADVQELKARHALLAEIVSDQHPAYHEAERREVEKVRAEFGDLYIDPHKLAAATPDTTAEVVELATHKPWSGYWYPFREKDMFLGEESPLGKLDQLLVAAGKEPGASAWEEKQQRVGQPWESSDGLCDAWAIAATLTPEPLVDVNFQGILFTPAQIKGLLVQKYSHFPKKRYGISYQGFLATDGMGQDLRPEAFHQLVTSLLAKKISPIVDTDPNFPIWNMPLYRYEWTIHADPANTHAYLASAIAYYTKFRNKESSEPTNYRIGRSSDIEILHYSYRLFVDPEATPLGLKVIYGEWLIDGLATTHPDTVFLPVTDAQLSPRNPIVGVNLELLNQLFEAVRQ